jgi:hypothetical protein
MHSKIAHLSHEEQQLIHDAPVLVTVLLAGADGDFLQSEIKEAVKIIHIKTYSESKDVRGVYKDIDGHSAEMIDEMIHSLPHIPLERTNILKARLSGLNHIFPKLDHAFAVDLFKSLRELAYYVSRAHDGGMGISYRNEQEKHLVHLDFLHEPKHA